MAEGMREETKSVARRRNKKTGECGKWKTGFLAPIGIKKTEAKEVKCQRERAKRGKGRWGEA